MRSDNRTRWLEPAYVLVITTLVSLASSASAQTRSDPVDTQAPQASPAETDANSAPVASPPGTDADTPSAPEAATESTSPSPDPSLSAWFLGLALSARVNPLGAELITDAGYRLSLSKSDNILLAGTHLDLGARVTASPAYVGAGPQIRILPLAILELQASVQRFYYFGTFGYIYDYGGLDADWSPERVSQVEDDGLGESTWGTLAEAGGALQMLYAGVAARVASKYAWMWMDDVTGAYLEPKYDLLLAPEDGFWITTALLGYVVAEQLLVGGLWEHTVTREGEVKRDIAGLLALWEIPASWWGSEPPQLAALVVMYANDPYRQGEFMVASELALQFLF